ncbi:MAG: DUF1638 domain-containing protein [Chloroflexota bacterium]
MSVIGIITCEILELEFAHLLTGDSEVEQITILEDRRAARFIEALEAGGNRSFRCIPHIKGFLREPSDRIEVLVRVLEFALHRKKEILQQALVRAAHELSASVDAILLGYGLCGSALDHPAELLGVRVPVFIPMDRDHPVDDCVGLLLGGRSCYYAEQRQAPGTFFMIPGWTHHWRRIFGEDFCGADPDTARRLFAHYERSLLVLTPVLPEAVMRRNAEEFNQLFGVRVETRQGTLTLLEEAWSAAKTCLQQES